MKRLRMPSMAVAMIALIGFAAAGQAVARSPGMNARSDEELSRSVKEAFRRDPELRDEDIHVRVRGGIVTLKGATSELALSREAREIAGEVNGVLAVNSNLNVASRGRSDSGIESELRGRLSRIVGFPSSGITFQVSGGVVTLEGRVDDPALRLFAGREAERVPGVVRVNNGVQVPSAPDSEIEQRIRGLVDSGRGALMGLAGTLEASVSSGTVTLTGKVSTFARKMAVEDTVLSQRGVKSVINRIEVVPDLGG